MMIRFGTLLINSKIRVGPRRETCINTFGFRRLTIDYNFQRSVREKGLDNGKNFAFFFFFNYLKLLSFSLFYSHCQSKKHSCILELGFGSVQGVLYSWKRREEFSSLVHQPWALKKNMSCSLIWMSTVSAERRVGWVYSI